MVARDQGRRTAERQSREAFLNAAIKILGEGGPEKLTVNALCERLGVTKGSFYHHFADTDEFVGALMRAWSSMLESFMTALVADADPIRQIEGAMVAWLNVPHEVEGAIRGWARSNPIVADAVRRQDALRERTSAQWLARFVDDSQRCRVLAHMGVTMLTGMQVRPPPIDRELLVEACVEFVRLITGLDFRKVSTADGPRWTVVTPG